MLSLELGLVNRESSQSSSLSFRYHHCVFELGHKLAWLFNEDWEGDEKLVFEAFLDADPGRDGVFEGVKAEAEGRISVEDVIEELSALFDLETVGPVEGSLVDCAS